MSKIGLQKCLNYSFPPNFLGYCGPAGQKHILEYRKKKLTDKGLVEHFGQYHTLYAYLSFIAYENDISDPFDERVVNAYWTGNNLLRKFDIRRFYYHLRDTLRLKKRLQRQELEILFGKLPTGALPTHAFHVLNVPWRTGHLPLVHTLATMDACRIGWGKVIALQDGHLKVQALPLVYRQNRLSLGRPIYKAIINRLKGLELLKVKKGDLVSFHWGVVCSKISLQEAQNLKYYTLLAINLANEDICRREYFS